MKILSWLWAFVPAPARGWVIGIAIAALIGGLAFAVSKIYNMGYDACKGEQAAAVVESKDTSRGRIVDTGKKYEKVKDAVVHQAGPNDPVGPRVGLAIDSMPLPAESGRNR